MCLSIRVEMKSGPEAESQEADWRSKKELETEYRSKLEEERTGQKQVKEGKGENG